MRDRTLNLRVISDMTGAVSSVRNQRDHSLPGQKSEAASVLHALEELEAHNNIVQQKI